MATDNEQTALLAASVGGNPYVALIGGLVGLVSDVQISEEGISSKAADIAESDARKAEAEARKAEAEAAKEGASSALTVLGGAASGGGLGFLVGGPVGGLVGAIVGGVLGSVAGGGE